MFKSILILFCVAYSSFSFAVDCSPRFDFQSNEYAYGSQSAFSDACRFEMRRETFKGQTLTADETEFLITKDNLAKKSDDLLKLAVTTAYTLMNSPLGYGDILKDQSLKLDYLTYQVEEFSLESQLFLLNQSNRDANRAAIYAKEKLIFEAKKAHVRQNLFKIRDHALEPYFIQAGFSSDEVITNLQNITDSHELRSFIDGIVDSVSLPNLSAGELASDQLEATARINDYYIFDKITEIVLWNNRNRVGTPVYYRDTNDFSVLLEKIEKINEFRAINFFDRASLVSIVRYKGLVVPSRSTLLWQNVSGRFIFAHFVAQVFNYPNGPVELTQRDRDAFNFSSSFNALERNLISTLKVFWGDRDLITDLKWYKFKKGYSQFFEL